MHLLFVYGSLKQGFANEHVNTGTRVPGVWRTCERHPMVLLGDGEVPCLIATPGQGHLVQGELYEVDDAGLQRMDRLERLGDTDGYERVPMAVERVDAAPGHAPVLAMAYVKREAAIPPGTPRIGPLDAYRAEHAQRFRWRGAD